VVFKIQANMDPLHRDRIAFLRICSGRFTRGMRLVNCRTGKELRTSNAMSFLSQRRETVEEGFAGDIIGIPNRGTIALGDALTEGEVLRFSGLPFFAPELFRRVELASPMKAKQLRTGLRQLGEEGAIQIFHPWTGGGLILAAAGALQFDVAAYRLQHEYGVDMRLLPTPYVAARWITSDDPLEMKRFVDVNTHRLARDDAGFPAFLAPSPIELQVAMERWKKIAFRAQREHAGYGEAEQTA
jgi:peptide chain release factor 3